ncbi:cilia- and flagella-associated protein 20 isoform X3 [Hordeum vulgare subsp. vulgare]|uniref:cilia- and flagella-associated protein 20 isoform X3 n=1 Tax=Hordeum vulgare subsp. vulgare TaxID=112509 RepID=UPI001D1A52BD|nr:cilia- and flagella-associated protein 20 isoform X3 [Hordeum vulgare subsp. vulgare]
MFKNTFQSGFLSILYSLGYAAWWPCIGLTSYTAFFSLVWIPHALCFSMCYFVRTKPLQIWDKEVVDGHIKRPQDEDIKSNVLEIVGTNVQSTYITCPADPAATLGIKLPFLALIVKNLKKYFTFEVHILDDKNVRRRFRASNFQVFRHKGKAIYLHDAVEA